MLRLFSTIPVAMIFVSDHDIRRLELLEAWVTECAKSRGGRSASSQRFHVMLGLRQHLGNLSPRIARDDLEEFWKP